MPRAIRYFNEIQTPRERYGLIDHERLMVLTGVKSRQDFKELHRSWIDEGLAKGNHFRDDRWTESLAVGGGVFVKEIQEALGARASGRSVISEGEQSSFGIFNNLTMPILAPKRPV